MSRRILSLALLVTGLVACGNRADLSVTDGMGPEPILPPPDASRIPTVDIAPARGWPEDGRPEAAAGLAVNAFACGFQHPRWVYVLPNGDVLIAESNAQPGAFYGWPYSYFGDNVDERVRPQRPDLVEQAIVPDYALGPHTASLGLAFYDEDALPERFRGGAFVAQHGSMTARCSSRTTWVTRSGA